MVLIDCSRFEYCSLGASAVYLQRGSGVFGQGVGLIALSNVQCIGSESKLIDCPSGLVSCSHGNDAGVRCLRRGIISY